MAPDNPDLRWAGSAFDTASTQSYRTYSQYLNGDQPLSFATPKFRSAFGRHFEEFSYNRCSMVVDAMADRMQVSGFGSDDEDQRREARARRQREGGDILDDGTVTIAQQAEDIWNSNTMDVRQGQVHREQFAAGDAYVYVEKDPDTGDILIWPQSAANVRVRYDINRPGERDLAVKRWQENGYWRLNLYYRDRIEKYRSPNRSALDTAASTTVETDANAVMSGNLGSYEKYEVDGEDWPVMLDVTDTVPIFHFANNAPVGGYGISELHDVIPIQDALNKSLMDLLVAMEFGAFPQRYMINVDTEAEGAEESIQKFQSGIDRILSLVGGEGVALGEFSATNIQQYRDVVEMFDTLISRVSKVPVHYLMMSSDFGSGTARRLAEAPFVAKMEDRITAAKATWHDVMRYAIRLTGNDIPAGALRVNFETAAPIADEERLQMMLAKKTLGLPLEQILKEDGYEPDQIAQIMQLKQEEADRQRQMFDAGFALNGSQN